LICAGIDVGSRALKIALLDSATLETVASGMMDQGVKQDALAQQLFKKLLSERGLNRSDVSRIVATGYGRNIVSFADTTITEITCHARGVRKLIPDAITIIDIGGQDSKLIQLSVEGTVQDFVTNDRCAAGTGSFLEVVASRLGVQLEALGDMARRSL